MNVIPFASSVYRYLFDLFRNKFFAKRIQSTRIPTFAFHFSRWKRPLLILWFPDRKFYFYPLNMTKLEQRQLFGFINSLPNAEVMVWGCHHLPFFDNLLNRVRYLEDGFIRSVNLGALHTPPFSIIMDSRTPFFDATQQSDLEVLLNSYDFNNDETLMKRSKHLIKKVLELEISKYNYSEKVDIRALYGEKSKKRVLVIGQVEDDASIQYGCTNSYTNNDLIRIAANENKDAQIFYKPHPDVLNDLRPKNSNPDDVQHLCTIIQQDLPIAQAFESIDHVYTITSLAGFEAILRGIKVTTLGCPFYAGWGLTDDRQPNMRRNRTLTPEQVFAGAFILYPLYYDYSANKWTTIERTIEMIHNERAKKHADSSKKSSVSSSDLCPKGCLSGKNEQHH